MIYFCLINDSTFQLLLHLRENIILRLQKLYSAETCTCELCQSQRECQRESRVQYLLVAPPPREKLHQPVVFILFTFSLSPLAAFVALVRTSCPCFAHSLPLFLFISKNQPSSKVSEMQCQARTLCAIWISVFVAKQPASIGFHPNSKSPCVMRLSRPWDEAGLCRRNTSPPLLRSVHVISSPNKELSGHCSQMGVDNLFPPFLAFSALFFPPLLRGVRCPALTALWDGEPPSPPLCLPGLAVIDETRCLWGSDEWWLLSVWKEGRQAVLPPLSQWEDDEMWQILSHSPETMCCSVCCSPLTTPVNNSSFDLLNIWIQTSGAIPKTSSEIMVPHSQS